MLLLLLIISTVHCPLGSSMSTYPDHGLSQVCINRTCFGASSAYNQAMMNGGAGLGGLGTGMIPGYTNPSTVGGAGTYYARELEDYNSRDLYNIDARGLYNGLNDLD